MTTKKKYYVCLRFKKRPKIHMTLRYFKGLAPDGLASLVAMLSEFMSAMLVSPFTPRFSIEARYGPQHTVRVLEPRSDQLWPGWVMRLLAELPAGDDTYKWHPHVACQDSKLNLEVIAVSLMCKKVEVARWDL